MSSPGLGLFKKLKDIVATKEGRAYLRTTHFWGPVTNFGIPIAAMKDIFNDPKYISGNTTFALTVYSSAFMRFALKVKPQNLLLFSCHITNFVLQNVQFIRFIKFHYLDPHMC